MKDTASLSIGAADERPSSDEPLPASNTNATGLRAGRPRNRGSIRDKTSDSSLAPPPEETSAHRVGNKGCLQRAWCLRENREKLILYSERLEWLQDSERSWHELQGKVFQTAGVQGLIPNGQSHQVVRNTLQQQQLCDNSAEPPNHCRGLNRKALTLTAGVLYLLENLLTTRIDPVKNMSVTASITTHWSPFIKSSVCNKHKVKYTI